MTTEEKLNQIKEINSKIDRAEEILSTLENVQSFELMVYKDDVKLRLALKDYYIGRKNELLDQAEQLMKPTMPVIRIDNSRSA